MNLKDVYQALDQEKVRAWASQQSYPLEESDGYLFLTVPIFIKGVKDEITCQLELEKIQQKGLAFNFYKVIHKIERQEASTFRCEEECRFFV